MDFSTLSKNSYLARGSITAGLRDTLSAAEGNESISKQRWTNIFSNCKRNLESDFHELSSLENIKVFVRVKPETEAKESILSVEENVVTVTSSKDSVSFKNLSHAGTKNMSQKFTFTRAFGPHCTQEELFDTAVLEQLKEFLQGQNSLFFTYGATSAGKTYTMQGKAKDIGILPRSLDVIFNSLQDKLLPRATVKPTQHLSYTRLTEPEMYQEEEERGALLQSNNWKSSQASLSSRSGKGSIENLTGMNWRSELESRVHVDHRVDVGCSQEVYYSVWVSYAEIYNENIHDLLDKGEAMAQRGKFSRPALKLAEDASGNQYVKGLKHVCVKSADEALGILQYGQEHLHFAATKLNQSSSRSHCIFTVRIVQVADPKNPHVARVNMMAFCDLAGLERTSKTQSRGERLKEAGNINSSLLVLGRCLDALRHNMTHKDRVLIPYREAKLTRLFQSFLLGQGKACVLVNVAQDPHLCDETLQVLKFGALAKELVINVSRDSETTFQAPLNRTSARGSRFSQLVRRSLSRFSRTGGDSTNRTHLNSVLRDSSVLEEEKDDEDDADAYAPLIALIDKLKNQLISERQEKLMFEFRLRQELCDQFANQLVEIEASWSERLKESQQRQENLAEGRISLLTKSVKKMKRLRYEDEEENFDDDYDNLQADLRETRAELGHANAEILALRSAIKCSADLTAQAQGEKARMQFDLATCQLMSEETKDAVTDAKIRDYEELLKEAAEEYVKSQAYNEELLQELDNKSQALAEKADLVQDMGTQLEECGVILNNVTQRLNEKEDLCHENEEKVAQMEKRVKDLEAEVNQKEDISHENEAKAAQMEKRIKDLEAEKKEWQLLSDALRQQQHSNNSKNMGDVTFYQDMYEEKERKLLAAETELGNKEDVVAALEKRNASLQEELKNLQEDLEFCQIQLKTEEEKEELERKLTSVQQELSVCQRDLELQALEYADHVGCDIRFRAELETAQKRQEELLNSQREFEQISQELADKLIELELERDDLKGKLLAAQNQEASALEKQIVQLKKLENTLQEKEGALNAARDRILTLEKQEIRLSAQKAGPEPKDSEATAKRLEILEGELTALKAEKDAQEKTLEKYMKECVKSSRSCTDLTSQALDYQSKIQELEKSLAERESELVRIQQALLRAEQKCETERDLVAARDLELDRMQGELKKVLSHNARPSLAEAILPKTPVTQDKSVPKQRRSPETISSPSSEDNEANIKPKVELGVKAPRGKAKATLALPGGEPVAAPPSVRKSARKTRTAKKYYEEDEEDLIIARPVAVAKVGRPERLTTLRSIAPDSDEDDDFVPEIPKRVTRKKAPARTAIVEDAEDEEEPLVPEIAKKSSTKKRLPYGGKTLDKFAISPPQVQAESEEMSTRSGRRGRPRKV